MRKDKILNQKGLALLTVFFIFLVALIVVGAIAIISVTEIGTTRTNLDAEQAFNLAEAGIDWAKAQFSVPSWKLTASPSTMNVPSLSGVVVTISGPTGTPSGSYTITSKGSVSGTATAARAIQVTILLTKSSTQSTSGMFERAITANGNIVLGDHSTIGVSSPLPNGDGIAMLSNYSGSNAVVVGTDFSIAGYKVGLMAYPPTTYSGLNLTTQVVRPAPQDLVPTLTTSQMNQWKADAIADGIAKGTQHYFFSSTIDDINWNNGITLDGIYFVDVPIGKKLKINTKLAGQGTLVVNGKLDTVMGTQWSATPLALIIKVPIGQEAHLDMPGNPSITAYIYVDGNVTFNVPADGTPTIRGSIAANGYVKFNNDNASITYQSLGAGGPPGFSATTTLTTISSSSWKEVAP